MGKYYEYLIANGATAEEAKVLDTPIANKLYEKQQADYEAKQAELAKLDSDFKNYEGAVTNWHKENNQKLIDSQNDAIAARAEEARAKAALMEAQKRGLLDVAKDLNWAPDPPKKEETPAYVTEDRFAKIADSIGDNLARMQDTADEFATLFPGKRLNWQQERREAVAAGKDFYSHLNSKYKMDQARTEFANKEREAEIAKWKAEGKKEATEELASKFGNPMNRPMMPSSRPIFAPRNGDALRESKHPWEHADGQLSNDRVKRATDKLIERQLN